MNETIKDILLINIYWLSLPLIGFAILHYLAKQPKKLYGLNEFSKYILRQHTFIIFLYSFLTYYGIVAFLAIPSYIFNLPARFTSIIYVILIVGALIYLFINFFTRLFINDRKDVLQIKKINNFTLLLFISLALFMVIDYFLTMYVKAFYAGDAMFHLARITDIISVGYNIQSPHHSNLLEAAYHYNSVYSLYIPIPQIFKIPPYVVWEYSLSFFRLLYWIAIFTLAVNIFSIFIKNKRLVLLLSSAAVIAAIVLYSGKLFIANYPHSFVDILLIVLLLAIIRYERFGKDAVVLPILSIMIGLTHATYSLIALLFLGFYVIIKAIFTKSLFSKNNIVYALSICVLIITPLISYLMPGILSEEQLQIFSFQTIEVFGTSIRKPFVYLEEMRSLGIVIAVLSFIGMVYLTYIARFDKKMLSIFLSLFLFFPIIVYTPFVYEYVGKILPYWLLERFAQMNVLSMISMMIGIYALVKLFSRRIPPFNGEKYIPYIAVTIIICICILGARQSYAYLFQRGDWNQYGYSEIYNINYPILNGLYLNNDLVITNPERSFFLPSITPVDVLAVIPGHSTKSADTDNRLRCQESILKNLSYEDLVYIGADYVEVPFERLSSLGAASEYLKSVAIVPDFAVMQVNSGYKETIDINSVSSACKTFPINEKGDI